MTDFTLRIFITDHYLTKPIKNVDFIYNDFTKKSITQVPIIRIFGSTPKGQKVCAHIHGVFPYFYVPFFEDILIIEKEEKMEQFLQHFASCLSSAISLSFGNSITAYNDYVFKVVLVKGKPFYGYQENIQYFLKIYLYNPNHIKKAGDLLLNGAVMNTPIQPYETHLPYNLKFFIDYNLFGMNYLYTDSAMFRVASNYLPEGSFIDLDVSDRMDLSQKTWHIDQLPPDCMLDERICPKESFCELEIDICACDILNIHEVQKNIGQNPGLKDLWEEEKQRRISLGLDLDQLIGEEFEERPMAKSTTSEINLRQEWRTFCDSLEGDIVMNQGADEFFGTHSLEESEEDTDGSYLNESINTEYLAQALRHGDSFVLEAIDPKKNVNDEHDQEMYDFINTCTQMEEEGSVMFDQQSEISSIPSLEVLAKKCSFLSQVNPGASRTLIDLRDSDEDLFDKTIIDLSLDDSDDEGEGDPDKGIITTEIPTSRRDNVPMVRRSSSDDLFDDDSSVIILDTDDSDCDILETFDGADDDDDDEIKLKPKKRRKLVVDAAPMYRSPITTRSKPKPQNVEEESNLSKLLLENRKRKKAQSRKPRMSLSLKEDLCVMEDPVQEVVVEHYKKETFKDGNEGNNKSVPESPENKERRESIHSNRKIARKRVSMRLRNPPFEDLSSTSLAPSPMASTSAAPGFQSPSKAPRAHNPTFSTPSRSSINPFHKNLCDISPILKPSNSASKKKMTTVSFSIPEVSENSVHNSPQKSRPSSQLSINLTEKLEVLESMKKNLSQNLHDVSTNINFLTEGFESSMTSHLTVLSAEVQCSSESTLKPNPVTDMVLMFFYCIHHEADHPSSDTSLEPMYEEGIIYVDGDGQGLLTKAGFPYPNSYHAKATSTESEIFDEIMKLIKRTDPDILVGYETTRSSWGYILERAFLTKHALYHGLGRMPHSEKKTFPKKTGEEEKVVEWFFDELHCTGRVILDLWIIMRYDLTLTSYTLESVVDDVLKERVPLFTNQQLMAWYRLNLERHRVIHFWKYRVSANLRLLATLGIIGRTSEFAKIFGIEFYHVLSRGSQYRVEAMMLRLAKPQNLIAISPSVQQRAKQKAPECIPLTLEPVSGLYRDPVVVLDFQSLYPSVMIAYNYCFSTTLGNLDHIKGVPVGESFEFGCGKLHLEEETINKVGDNVNISPNKVLFVRPDTSKGIISKMVEEILTTRIMVKKSMKIHKENKALCKQLDARQLGLKLITNVTFGYTAASYSGRMPCVEVGDSILRKSRETLEEAIQMVNSGGPHGYPETDDAGGWQGCSVIYGDTDSMFVLMPGRTKDEAFILGNRIADAVTAVNPFPVKLKFEKVYLPCLLESKKKYVGHSYETPDQQVPKFDAKGIETVRRDNCNIVSKILERTLVRLFTSEKMDSIKRYILSELDKVLCGKINMADFIIAKEYRGRKFYQRGASVPALHIANDLRKKDVRAEPLPGERVPYVIIQGAPGDTLLSCVRQPCDLLFNMKLLKAYGNNIRAISEQGCKLSYTYYIMKQILPPLNRALGLIGINVFNWYSQMPKGSSSSTGYRGAGPPPINLNRTISSYFQSQKCMLCDKVIKRTKIYPSDNMCSVLCDPCLSKGSDFIYYCGTKQLKDIEDLRTYFITHCSLCTNNISDVRGIGPPCVSTDCPTLFDRIRAFQEPTESLECLLQSNIF